MKRSGFRGKRRARTEPIFDKAFVGTLSMDDLSVRMHFRAKVECDGEVEFSIRRRTMTRTLRVMHDRWRDQMSAEAEFALSGVSADGALFRTDDLQVSSFKRSVNFRRGSETVKLVAECSRATVDARAERSRLLPQLRWRLTGFECAKPLRAECALGIVTMEGEPKMASPGLVNGVLAIEAPEGLADHEAWRVSADRLLEHIRRVMSFGASTMLGAPIAEYMVGDSCEIELLSHTAQQPSAMRVIHRHDLRALLDSGIGSYFDPRLEIRNLPYAIEWHTIASSYDEIRLVGAMTALENLIDSNLPASDQMIMTLKSFDRVRKRLRSQIRDTLKTIDGVDSDSLLASFNEKLSDLNRRSLRQKLDRLAKAWQVPLGDIPEESIRSAITARNMVVHRGLHPGTEDERDLWRHVTLIREVVVRFLLSAIGYRGRYVSHLGGYRLTTYPPEPMDTGIGQVDDVDPSSSKVPRS